MGEIEGRGVGWGGVGIYGFDEDGVYASTWF